MRIIRKTTRASRQDIQVRDFILRHISRRPQQLVTRTAAAFGLSETAVRGYLTRLVQDSQLIAIGNTRARRYQLQPLATAALTLPGDTARDADDIWHDKLLPVLRAAPTAVLELCRFGFAQIFANAVTHATGEKIIVSATRHHHQLEIMVMDKGPGIFAKLKSHCDLPHSRAAALELAKGGLTTAPHSHAGMGLYLVQQLFSSMTIMAGDSIYRRTRRADGRYSVTCGARRDYARGTLVQLVLATDADWRLRDNFNALQLAAVGAGDVTVPVSLICHPAGTAPVTRMQARQLLHRLEFCTCITLDFDGVVEIGADFADEIFHAWRSANPQVEIKVTNADEHILSLIHVV